MNHIRRPYNPIHSCALFSEPTRSDHTRQNIGVYRKFCREGPSPKFQTFQRSTAQVTEIPRHEDRNQKCKASSTVAAVMVRGCPPPLR